MRAQLAALAALVVALAAAADQPPPVVVDQLPTSLAGEWLFRLGNDPAWASPFRERRDWQTIQVPGAWERHGYPGYNGHAWYRQTIFIPSQMAGEDLGLDLGMVGDVDEVFLNGRRVGGTGSFPPTFDKATLAHRFYQLPRDAIRYGEYNELAIHVYNDSRFGGLLGPAPRLDSFSSILRRQFLRDLLAYCLATLLATLAALHIVLLLVQRDAREHLYFAGFLLAVAMYFLTYTYWGPPLLIGHGGTFRLNVVALLAAVALFPPAFYRIARKPLPLLIVAIQTLFVLGAAFALVWREEGDLYLWVHLAEAGAMVIGAIVIRTLAHQVRRRRPWALALLVTSAIFIAAVALDILVDIGVLRRFAVGVGDLFAPLGLVPFAVVCSLTLAYGWVERRWGEPLDLATGLIPRDRFVDRLSLELERSRRARAPVSVALLRLGARAEDTAVDQLASRAVPLMRRGLRQIDLLARYDRETFALLLADTEERGAMAILERLRRSVADGNPGGHAHVPTTAGVAQFRPNRHVATEELLEEAEAALYAALSEGGDCTATAP
ncbi:MAG: diguanylate cyclase domain-containing protein [Acidobacteriota bacterium]